MPTPAEVLADPEFYKLDDTARTGVLSKIDPEYAKLPSDQQHKIVVGAEVKHAAKQVPGLDPDLAASVASAENAYRREGTSSAGAQGTMQVMPDTAKGVVASGRPLPQGVNQNIAIGTSYLGGLVKQFGGNEMLAAAAYNAGPGAVQAAIKAAGGKTDWASVSPHLPAETRDYVPRALGHKGATYLGVIHGGPASTGPGEGPTAPQEPGAPMALPSPSPEDDTGADEALSVLAEGINSPAAAGKFLGHVLYNGLVMPGNEANRLGYSLGIPGFDPPADHVKALQASPLFQSIDRADMARLDSSTPEGTWSRIQAAAGALEPTYAPTFGAYIAARTFGADEATARMIEMFVGAGGLLHEGTKVAANLAARRRIAAVAAPLERRLAEAKATAAQATAGAQANVAAAHAEVARTQLHLKTLQEAHDAGLTQVVEAERAKQAAEVAAGHTAKAALDTHTAGALDRVAMGTELTTPGNVGIVGGATKRLRQRVGAAYDHWTQVGTEAGIHLPAGAMRADMGDVAQQIEALTRTEGATPAERAVAQEISDVLTPTQGAPRLTEALRRAMEEGHYQPAAAAPPSEAPPIPIARLIELKSAIGKVGLSPQEFPVLRSRQGRLLFAELGARLDEALRSISAGHPAVEDASTAARQLAQEQFRLRSTAKKLLRAETPEAARDVLFSPRYPSRLMRLFKEASPAERIALQKSAMADIYRTSLDATGNPDYAAALKSWNKVVTSGTARLLAPIGSPEAAAELASQIAARRYNLNAPALVEAEQRTTNLLRDLARAQEAADRSIPDAVLGKSTPEISAASDALKRAQTAAKGAEASLATAEKIVPRAADRLRTKVLEFQATGGQRPGGFGSMMARRAAIGLAVAPFLGGVNLRTGVTSAAWIHLMLVYPKYVQAAIRTPLNTEHGLRMARAIAGLLNGYYGLPGNRPAGSSPAPPATPAAPAP